MSLLSRFSTSISLTVMLTALAIAPAFAAGDDTTAPPKPTPTPRCPSGQIHDQKSNTCVSAKSNALDDKDRYQAVRELAYAEKYASAALVLDAMANQQDDQVLTYRGFLLRKTGHFEKAMTVYESAVAANPNNLLVRSYMGQGLVEAGDLVGAQKQHQEILARRGEGTWAEVSLRTALATGKTHSY